MTEGTSMYGAESGVEAAEASAALQVKQQLDAVVESTRNSPDLNPQGIREMITHAYDEAETRYTQAINREEASAAERVRQAEKDVFKVSVGSARDYREAYQAAKYAGFSEPRVVQEKELSEMLTYAEKVGDAKLADAVFQRCVEDGFDEIGERYLSVRPEKAAKVQRLTEALESEQRVKQATGWARTYPLRKPPEYDPTLSGKERIRPADRISRAYSGGR